MSAAARRFEAACRRWQVTLGLTDWTLTFKTEQSPANGETQAEVAYDCDSRQATIVYYQGVKGAHKPARTALHEMLHVAVADMLAAAARLASDDHKDVRREEHRFIERILNAVDGRP